MYTLIAENKYSEQLELTHNPAYNITDIDGIDPAEAVINVSKNAGADGSVFNSAYVNDRQIVITLSVNAPTETNRIALYKFFKPKFPVTLYYQNATRNVYINGYVQNVAVGFFDKKQTVQITINCPQPFFNGLYTKVQECSNVESLFEFPFSIEESTAPIVGQAVVGTDSLGGESGGIEFSRLLDYFEATIFNDGDVETGALITIKASGAVDTPKIYNVETNESFIINTTLQAGDLVTINTRRGEKALTLLRNGVTIPLIGSLAEGSTWFQLVPSDNVFTLDADSGVENMLVTFTINDQYEGV